MSKLSPVTHSKNVTKITDFSVEKILSLYDKTNIPVERFFTGLRNVELFRCDDTGYRFYYPFSIFGDDQFYQDLYSTVPNYYYPDRWEYGFAISNIPQNVSVLEIGSGAGLFLKKLIQNKCTTVGLELNSKAIADSKAAGLNVLDERIEEYSQKHLNEFDVVCSFQVLEHVTEVKSFIEGALKSLKAGGRLILSVPNSNPYFLKFDKYHTLNLPPHHAGLWNKDALEKIAPVFRMKVVSIKAEPLKEYKEWYKAHINHYRETRPFSAFLLKLIPRPVYKLFLHTFSKNIQGSYITAIYEKQ